MLEKNTSAELSAHPEWHVSSFIQKYATLLHPLLKVLQLHRPTVQPLDPQEAGKASLMELLRRHQFSMNRMPDQVSLHASLNSNEQVVQIFESLLRALSRPQLIDLTTRLIHRFHVGWLSYNNHLIDPLQDLDSSQLLEKVYFYLQHEPKALLFIVDYLGPSVLVRFQNVRQ